MPVGEGSEAQDQQSKNTPRLAKVRESEAFASAGEMSPPEAPAFQHGSRLTGSGWMFVTLGVLWVVADLLLETVGLMSMPLGYLLVLVGIIQFVRGVSMRKQATSHALLSRPAVILSRRSEVDLRGFSGTTTYFFELELEQGVIAEFAYPGRGPSADVYSNNISGIAFTRGSTLLEFKQVRT